MSIPVPHYHRARWTKDGIEIDRSVSFATVDEACPYGESTDHTANVCGNQTCPWPGNTPYRSPVLRFDGSWGDPQEDAREKRTEDRIEYDRREREDRAWLDV